MLIELNGDNRAPLRHLFAHYPYLHGSVAAALEGGMGQVFTDSLEAPRVALAILDFHFLAGDPLDQNAPLLFQSLQPGDVVVAPTPEWQHRVATLHPHAWTIFHREAFRSETFDVAKLKHFSQSLPSGYLLRPVRPEEVPQFATDLHPALIYNFPSPEDFITRGIGLGILHQGKFVAGASSAAIGGGKLEIEIQTHPQFRRRGLARAAASALILHCLEHNLEPCWDAANEPSASLARQLGFHSTGKYEACRLKPPEV